MEDFRYRGRVHANKKIVVSSDRVWVASVLGTDRSHSVEAFWFVDRHVETKRRSKCKWDKDRPQQFPLLPHSSLPGFGGLPMQRVLKRFSHLLVSDITRSG